MPQPSNYGGAAIADCAKQSAGSRLIGLARKPNEGPATTLLGKLSCAIAFAVRRVGADTKTKGVHMTPFAAVVLPDVMMWMVLALTGIMVIGLIDAVVFRWRGHQQ